MVSSLELTLEQRKTLDGTDIYWPGIRFRPSGNGDSAGGCVRFPSGVRVGKENQGKIGDFP